MTAEFSGLTPNTTYHYRLVATNEKGTNKSADATVTPLTVIVDTGEAEPAVNDAVLHGTVNPDGLPTTFYFEYGRTASYGRTTSTPPGDPVGTEEAGDQPVSAEATELLPNTTLPLPNRRNELQRNVRKGKTGPSPPCSHPPSWGRRRKTSSPRAWTWSRGSIRGASPRRTGSNTAERPNTARRRRSPTAPSGRGPRPNRSSFISKASKKRNITSGSSPKANGASPAAKTRRSPSIRPHARTPRFGSRRARATSPIAAPTSSSRRKTPEAHASPRKVPGRPTRPIQAGFLHGAVQRDTGHRRSAKQHRRHVRRQQRGRRLDAQAAVAALPSEDNSLAPSACAASRSAIATG